MSQVSSHSGRRARQDGEDPRTQPGAAYDAVGGPTGQHLDGGHYTSGQQYAPPTAQYRMAPGHPAVSQPRGQIAQPHLHRATAETVNPSWSLGPTEEQPARGRHATTYGQNFSRVVGWTLLGSLVPGVGFITAGRRTLGGAVLFITALLSSAALTYALIGNPRKFAEGLVADPNKLVLVAGVLLALTVAWAAIVMGTHASLRKYAHLGTLHRAMCALLVSSLIGLIAIPTAKAGSYALIARDALTSVFGASGSAGGPIGGQPDAGAGDPWAGTDRVNVLLIGSDAGADRTGIRPDTMILASIDTQNGETVLFSLPRNLQRVPFPPNTPQAAANPYGFYCINPSNGVNTECLMNSLWTFGEDHWKEYYPTAASEYEAGLRATEDGVEQVTGLQIDQYAMLNLRGFMQFVDAVGGITVNVKERLPIGGSSENRVPSGWIELGDGQHLDGYHALWYARSRWSTSDYSRMTRQRCVIGAVVNQADPVKVAAAFPQIAKAAKTNITTDIPLRDLPAWLELALRVKKAHVRSLPFTDAVIDTADPDIAKMRSLVQDAISQPPAPSPSAAAPSPAAAKPSAGKPSSKPASTPRPDASEAQDVNAACS